jgi:hypothetical protein
MCKQTGHAFFSKLDISIQYYTFALDEESKDLTTIVTLFGKYCYNVLPMGLKCLPDFAQETMENIFCNIDDSEVYIDNIGAPPPQIGSTILSFFAPFSLNYRRMVPQ